MWVPNRKGRADLHFFSPKITKNSVVHIAISEASALGPPDIVLGIRKFSSIFGAASISVQNISVRDGAVDFYVHVDWSSPLNLVADITILDPPIEIIYGR
jgi:hypothetical protein